MKRLRSRRGHRVVERLDRRRAIAQHHRGGGADEQGAARPLVLPGLPSARGERLGDGRGFVALLQRVADLQPGGLGGEVRVSPGAVARASSAALPLSAATRRAQPVSGAGAPTGRSMASSGA